MYFCAWAVTKDLLRDRRRLVSYLIGVNSLFACVSLLFSVCFSLCLTSPVVFCCQQSGAAFVRQAKLLNVYKRNICGAEHSPWGGTVWDGYLDHTGWGLFMNKCCCSAVLSHSLCLDMNGKESITVVVNTGALPSSLFISPLAWKRSNCNPTNAVYKLQK